VVTIIARKTKAGARVQEELLLPLGGVGIIGFIMGKGAIALGEL